MASDSILDSTKKMLGFDPDYTEFDLDIIAHINSVFFTLRQLGVGPTEGFLIEDRSSKWQDFMRDDHISAVRSYMYLKVRMLFDPPATSFTQAAYQKQIEEYEFRLNVYMEGVRYPWPPQPIVSETP